MESIPAPNFLRLKWRRPAPGGLEAKHHDIGAVFSPRRRAGSMFLLFLLPATHAFAHELEIAGPQNTSELLRAWTFEPGVVIPIVASALLYSLGIVRLHRASPKSVRKSDIVYFGLG